MPTRNNYHRKSICMSWPLSMKQAAKFTFTHPKSRTQNIIYPPEKTIILEQAAFWHEVKDVCCLPVPSLHSVRWFEHFGGITALLVRFSNALWIMIFARYCIVIKDIHNISKASKYFPQFGFSWNHDFCVVKPASKMCSNSTCECDNKLILYLLNNKVFSYLTLANTVSVLRTYSQLHPELFLT